MKLNFGLLGIALGQSGDDYEGERQDYGDYGGYNGYDNGYNNNVGYQGFGGEQSYSFNDFGGKYAEDASAIKAIKLSCWNSNSLRDMNHDGKFGDAATGLPSDSERTHHYHHQYGFENAYDGSKTNSPLADHGDVVDSERYIDVSDADHTQGTNVNKWGYQSDNRDAKYHYGHHVAEADLSTSENRPDSTQMGAGEAAFNGVVDDWRFSLRHAGCLYEAPDYYYGAKTFKAIRYLTYSYNSYDDAGLVTGAAGVDDNATGQSMVHWIHVFNAHIHIDQALHCSGTNAVTTQACFLDDDKHHVAVVMANPTYEGLGFINFVATYHDRFITSADDAGLRFASTFAKSAMYENAGHWHLTTSGKDTIDNSVTTSWHLPCNSGADGCDTTDWLRSTKDRGFAISSFPHNELGQDFRFNIRTLHQMGDGYARSVIRADADSNYSYFFYAVNKITITFPHHVGYVNDCWRLRNAGDKCTKDKVHQIIVDQSSVQTTIANNLQNGNDIGDGNYQFKALLSGSTNCASGLITDSTPGAKQCASWCDVSGNPIVVNGHRTDKWSISNLCGTTLDITGMLSTYDEIHLRQFGTIQEIWVQLQYAYSEATAYVTDKLTTGMESPFPNIFFSAPDVVSVSGACTGDLYSKCDGYTRYENVPYAGHATDATRWNTNVDGHNSQRGDGFWVDTMNVSK